MLTAIRIRNILRLLGFGRFPRSGAIDISIRATNIIRRMPRSLKKIARSAIIVEAAGLSQVIPALVRMLRVYDGIACVFMYALAQHQYILPTRTGARQRISIDEIVDA
eukprot:395087-Amorphochlora_amoeboformis.AAC.1